MNIDAFLRPEPTRGAFKLCALAWVALAVGTACTHSAEGPPEAPEQPGEPPPATPGPDAPAPLEPAPPDVGEPASRPALTAAECEGQGGAVVGDIGDGAIHRPDYRCPSGDEPIGSIAAAAGGPVAVEGAVCCPQ